MTHDTPRGIQFIRVAIRGLESLGELGKLRQFALEQWGDDPIHAELQALLDTRQAELEGRADSQLPLPFWDDADRDAS